MIPIYGLKGLLKTLEKGLAWSRLQHIFHSWS